MEFPIIASQTGRLLMQCLYILNKCLNMQFHYGVHKKRYILTNCKVNLFRYFVIALYDAYMDIINMLYVTISKKIALSARKTNALLKKEKKLSYGKSVVMPGGCILNSIVI